MPSDKEIKVVFADDEIEIKDMREDLDIDRSRHLLKIKKEEGQRQPLLLKICQDNEESYK